MLSSKLKVINIFKISTPPIPLPGAKNHSWVTIHRTHFKYFFAERVSWMEKQLLHYYGCRSGRVSDWKLLSVQGTFWSWGTEKNQQVENETVKHEHMSIWASTGKYGQRESLGAVDEAWGLLPGIWDEAESTTFLFLTAWLLHWLTGSSAHQHYRMVEITKII